MLSSSYSSERQHYDSRVVVETVWTGRIHNTFSWTDDAASVGECIALAPDGRIVAIGDRRGNLRLWHVDSGRLRAMRSLMRGKIESIDFSADGQTIAVAGRRGVLLWKWQTEADPFALPGLPAGGQVARFSDDARLLAVGSSQDEVAARIWRIDESRWQHVLSGNDHRYYREGLCFSADQSQLIVPARNAEALEFFDLQSGRHTHSIQGGGIEPRDVAVSADGKYLAAVGSQAVITVVELASGQRNSDQFVGHGHSPYELLFSSDGRRIVTAGRDGAIRQWDVESSRQLQHRSHGDWVSAIGLSADGRYLASCSLDNTLRLWDMKADQVVHQVVGHGRTGGNRLTKVAFSDDGRRFISFGHDLLLRSWDVQSGRLAAEHSLRPTGLAFQVDEEGRARLAGDDADDLSSQLTDVHFLGEKKLVLGRPGALHVFDIDSGKELKVIHIPEHNQGFELSADGRRLAAMYRMAPAAFANLEPASRRSVLQIEDSESPEAWQHKITLAGSWSYGSCFSPDARWLAVGLNGSSPDRRAASWISIIDVERGREVARIEHFDKGSNAMKFSPDGLRLAVSYEDTTVMIWDWQQLRLPAAE